MKSQWHGFLTCVSSTPVTIDAEWGYALAMAGDEHAEKMELIPDLQPLCNGDSVVGPNGSYYMGGVNNGQGLDAEQSDQLNRMIDGDEPRGEEDMDEDVELFAWFSDEVFAGGSDIDEW
ncbi:hypothetical protein FB451DRAFT_1166598 [Mycena latifolia]|nr:hypothetical protein FB451DRAFT_1166598 [Mycena latifolia]